MSATKVRLDFLFQPYFNFKFLQKTKGLVDLMKQQSLWQQKISTLFGQFSHNVEAEMATIRAEG